MSESARGESLPMKVREQLDAQCDLFEQAWNAGETPSMDRFILGTDERARAYLLRDLIAIERHYRNSRGQSSDDQDFIKRYPDLLPDLAHELRRIRNARIAGGPANSPSPAHSAPSDPNAPTLASPTKLPSSGGLHIRCPHCSSPVELLNECPMAHVTCSTCGSAFSLVDRQEETGLAIPLKTIGRFELISQLGTGGFGTVWKARDLELDRTVAIKIPRKGQLDAQEITQFLREARSAAQLRHPHIVPVHEIGREADTIFIVSDYVRGVSLSDWMTATSPSAREIAQLMALIADALHHAHEHGVIHRDLKPSNVLMDEQDRPHLMDFGLAKREVGEVTMTIDGQILGTPAYMSPEQAQGKGHWTDRRTDIYSLGVMLFRMLTGELPFRGNTQLQIYQRLRDDPPDPRSLNRTIPRDMATICLKCMERDPHRRYARADDLALELRRFLDGEPIVARPISRTARAIRWAQRKPALATALGLTVFLAIAGPTTAWVIDGQKRQLKNSLTERDNLVRQLGTEKDRDAHEIERLKANLAIWEGEGNPWSFWPGSDRESPRHSLLLSALEAKAVPLATLLSTAPLEAGQQLYGHLALAIIHDELERTDDALAHYRAAAAILRSKGSDLPNGIDSDRAITYVLMQIARLEFGVNRADAQRTIIELQAHCRQRLERRELLAGPSTILARAESLEAELYRAKMVAFDRSRIERIASAKDALEQDLPDDPYGLYQLACYLAERDDILR